MKDQTCVVMPLQTMFPLSLDIDNNIIHLLDNFSSAMMHSLRLNGKIINTFSDVYSVYIKAISEGNNTAKDLPELEKIVKSRINKIFDQKFREKDFVNTLSDTVSSYSTLAKSTGFGQAYQNFSNWCANWNNIFIEPLRDTFWRTPSHKIAELEKYSLFHYRNNSPITTSITTAVETSNTVPLLMVYAFINRHYILDLIPEVSVVRNLLKQGFDINATDWGTPSAYDKDLNIGHFVNSYMDKSIDLIRETTKSDKVSLLGYCWGGDLVLMYAALYPEKVKNVITVATPGDFSEDDTLLSLWTKSMDVETRMHSGMLHLN